MSFLNFVKTENKAKSVTVSWRNIKIGMHWIRGLFDRKKKRKRKIRKGAITEAAKDIVDDIRNRN